MPINDKDSIENQIPHGEHLTFVDKLRASFLPPTGNDDNTGRPTFPKEDFLTAKAKERKAAYDAENSK